MSTNYRYNYTDINYYQHTMITEIAPTITLYIYKLAGFSYTLYKMVILGDVPRRIVAKADTW